jgi:hypothetical protein
MKNVWIETTPTLDVDDSYVTKSCPANARTILCDFDTRYGVKGILTKVANYVEAAGAAACYFSLLVNGIPVAPRYDRFQNMVSRPDDTEAELPIHEEIQQGARLQLIVDNTDPSTAFSATGYMRVKYHDL